MAISVMSFSAPSGLGEDKVKNETRARVTVRIYDRSEIPDVLDQKALERFVNRKIRSLRGIVFDKESPTHILEIQVMPYFDEEDAFLGYAYTIGVLRQYNFIHLEHSPCMTKRDAACDEWRHEVITALSMLGVFPVEVMFLLEKVEGKNLRSIAEKAVAQLNESIEYIAKQEKETIEENKNFIQSIRDIETE